MSRLVHSSFPWLFGVAIALAILATLFVTGLFFYVTVGQAMKCVVAEKDVATNPNGDAVVSRVRVCSGFSNSVEKSLLLKVGGHASNTLLFKSDDDVCRPSSKWIDINTILVTASCSLVDFKAKKVKNVTVHYQSG